MSSPPTTDRVRIGWPSWLGLALALLVAAGCNRTARNVETLPSVPKPKVRRAAVEAGDILIVEVFGEQGLSGKFQVTESGTIDYPLIGRVRVISKTPPQIAALLRTKLAAGYLRKPSVSVLLKGYAAKRQVYVWGQVHKSGTYPYSSNMTIVEAIALAGGLTPMADRGGVTLRRVVKGKSKQFRVPIKGSEQYRLKPGDVVFVPERVF